MKSQIKKSFLTLLVLVFAFVNFIAFAGTKVTANADTDNTHFGNLELYSVVTSTETVNYTRREDSKKETVNGVPLYLKHNDLDNSCGATAGAIVLGFYDKYYENLIPNFTSYFPATGKYKTADKVYIPALMTELYNLMRINIDMDGVRENDCLNGLKSYVSGKNQTIGYTQLNSSSQLNVSAYMNAIDNNKPVLLFCYRTELITEFISGTTQETINKAAMELNHIYVGYGYYTVKYYNGSNNFRTDTYLKVACGVSGLTQAFIKISSTAGAVSHSWLVNAYSVTIS